MKVGGSRSRQGVGRIMICDAHLCKGGSRIWTGWEGDSREGMW